MYARLNMFSIGAGKRAAAEKLVNDFAPVFKTQKGFKGVTFFGDDAAGEYGSFSLWDTRQDAEAANAAMLPQLQRALAGAGLQIQGTPVRRIAEVVEPKSGRRS